MKKYLFNAWAQAVNRIMHYGRKWYVPFYRTATTYLRGFLMLALGLSAACSPGREPVHTTVFTAGESGFPYFRIPTIVTSHRGTVLAFAEGRHHATDHGRNDIVLKRSEDSGKTWGPLVIIHEDPELVMVNPSPLVTGDGTILLFYETFPFGYHARKGSEKGITFQMLEPGFDGPGNQRLLLRTSRDDGRTWSEPRYLERETRRGKNIITSGSPANGIQLQRGGHRGRIMIPLYLGEALDRGTGKRTFHCSVFYSDDNGVNWQLGQYVPLPDEAQSANECLVAELDDGRIMMNARYRAKNRYVAFSEDGGETWSPFAADPILAGRPCHSGLLRYSLGTSTTRSRLIFSNNFNLEHRATGTVRVSYDNGESWGITRTVVPGFFGYSQLTRLRGGDVGMIYEPFESPAQTWNIDFVSMSLNWLSDGVDAGNEPRVVGIPPADAGRGLVRVSSNEIRHYGGNKDTTYLVSTDNGATWEKSPLPATFPRQFGGLSKEAPSFAHNPTSGEYIRVLATRGYVWHSRGGLDGEWTRAPAPSGQDGDDPYLKLGGIMRTPLFVNRNRRLLIPAHGGGAWTWYSDDGGHTFARSNKIQTPHHEPGGIHRGRRWNHGAAEATLVELRDGRMWMILRTAQDHYYESFSSDFGEFWSEPAPSRFHGTITMPTFKRLRDGRILFLWSNTAPLPELARATGRGEDVFTNRDMHHAAISEDDGKTWIGFREIILDEHRNDDDYAVTPGSNDRGKHQSEALELDDGQVLIALGQHPLHRKLVILDTDWLYETTRSDDFSQGLNHWSHHKYLPEIRGHCGYNRKPGGVFHPELPALQLRRPDDPECVNEAVGASYQNDGATWNFPAGQEGELEIELRLNEGGQGVVISLLDRWFNPVDLTAGSFAMYRLVIPGDGRLGERACLIPGEWHRLALQWSGTTDTAEHRCRLLVDGDASGLYLPLQHSARNGLSYVHFISAADSADLHGVALRKVKERVR